MKRLSTICMAAFVVMAGAGGLHAQGNAQAEKQIEAARRMEVVDGNLKGAIAQYAQIVNQFKSQPEIAARALFQLAQLQEKLGQAEAKKSYERILREYAGAAEYASAARTRLAAIDARPLAAGAVPTVRRIWADKDTDATGSVSADGRYISFTDWSTGDVAIRDLTTGKNRRLTHTGGWEASSDYCEYSSISPDGTLVAYSWFSDKTKTYDLRILGAGDPGKPRVLHPAAGWMHVHGWTPDGRQLVIVRSAAPGRNEMAIVSVADGSVRVVKLLTAGTPMRISVSPDGRYLAYDSGPVVDSDLFVLPLQGGSETVVVAGGSSDHEPVWSPDGSRLVFISNRTGTNGLWSIRMDAGKPQGRPEPISAAAGRPLGFTRDGSLFQFKYDQVRNVYVADLDERTNRAAAPTLLTERFVNSNSGAVWSPDGAHVAFLSARGAGQATHSTTLVIRTVRTGEERDVPLKLTVVAAPQFVGLQWFPDGRSVLIAGRAPQQRALAYYRTDTTTGETTLLRRTTGQSSVFTQVRVSPDGKALFHPEADGEGRLYRLLRFDLETGRETELKKAWVGSMSLSPDGSQLAYIGNTGDASSSRTNQVAVMAASGGDGRVLFEGPWFDGSRYNTLGWTPDSRFVLFVRQDNGGTSNSIWRVPAAGGTAEKIGITQPGQIKSPHVHPDGRRIVYSTSEPAPAEIWVLENFLPPSKS